MLLLLTMLTGCGGYVSNASMYNADKLCGSNGGVKHLSIWAAYTLVCNNGAEFDGEDWMRTNNQPVVEVGEY